MACDHKGGPEVIAMAEEHLRSRNIPESDWSGLRFRWAENVEGGYWPSVVVEVERREENWVVVRLDRNKETIPEEETGFRAV